MGLTTSPSTDPSFHFPTAPSRLSNLGTLDAVSSRHVDLNARLFSSLYNPYAAGPAMHIGYALIVGASLTLHARYPIVLALSALRVVRDRRDRDPLLG